MLPRGRAEVFIGIPKALSAQRSWAGEVRLCESASSSTRGAGALTLDGLRLAGRSDRQSPRETAASSAASSRDVTAAILFTSGSTGPPKGVVYTHAIFQAQVDMLRSLYSIEPGEIDLCTFPLFALFAPALGLTAIVPEMDPTRPARVDPQRIFEAIEDFGVTNLFGSPALLKPLVEGAEASGRRLPTLKRVISAGAPVPASIIERLAGRLDPHAQVYTPYGATESLPVASIGSAEVLRETRHATDQGRGVCVGRPVPGMVARVIAISDEPIPMWSDQLLVPDGVIGEIVVAGPVVTRKYFQRPEADSLAKIDDPATGSFYHRMGDVGYLDREGRLWFCGRKSHRVVCGDQTLYTIPCEAIFNRHPAVARTALVGVRREQGVSPVICIELAMKLSRIRGRKVEERIDRRGRRVRSYPAHSEFPVSSLVSCRCASQCQDLS